MDRSDILRVCACCKGSPTILLAQSMFCTQCFMLRLQKGFFGEIRKSLSHTPRHRVRKVLVVVEDTLASRAVEKLTRESKSSMVEYHYCSFTQGRPNCIYIDSIATNHSGRVEAAREYGFDNNYDCVLFSLYSVEVAYELLKMITAGEVAQYTTAFKGDKIMSICYPFYSLSYKSVLYYCMLSGILDQPFSIKTEDSKTNRAHKALLRDLLKNSPASILNLIKIQQRVEDM
ncbi:hypothetical protein NEMIN01_0907 [Nematocida minor]|uniref:uncharacterized protein n=1 Tax=Nematocida minor TaxID=1912983 RepID=UPI00221E7B08|nr:uncharacterized protein NEMIN01_0907 [Nematocida minor]KAI5190208.1 hypothetical protein NEMIN01_0907 [Nematocida minor]